MVAFLYLHQFSSVSMLAVQISLTSTEKMRHCEYLLAKISMDLFNKENFVVLFTRAVVPVAVDGHYGTAHAVPASVGRGRIVALPKVPKHAGITIYKVIGATTTYYTVTSCFLVASLVFMDGFFSLLVLPSFLLGSGVLVHWAPEAML